MPGLQAKWDGVGTGGPVVGLVDAGTVDRDGDLGGVLHVPAERDVGDLVGRVRAVDLGRVAEGLDHRVLRQRRIGQRGLRGARRGGGRGRCRGGGGNRWGGDGRRGDDDLGCGGGGGCGRGGGAGRPRGAVRRDGRLERLADQATPGIAAGPGRAPPTSGPAPRSPTARGPRCDGRRLRPAPRPRAGAGRAGPARRCVRRGSAGGRSVSCAAARTGRRRAG